jgi:hypothetical protein
MELNFKYNTIAVTIIIIIFAKVHGLLYYSRRKYGIKKQVNAITKYASRLYILIEY